ncbi:MAG: NADH-quinone oxidoreductase subunit K [Planctomycetota bacterium]
MTLIVSVCVAVIFGTSIYLMLGRELKSVAMGVFLLGHAANLCILAQSGSPLVVGDDGDIEGIKRPPILGQGEPKDAPLNLLVDPLPQALILTAIVISFGVMAFLLTLLVKTARSQGTLDLDELAQNADAHDGPVTVPVQSEDDENRTTHGPMPDRGNDPERGEPA